jgi:hypothetical protein
VPGVDDEALARHGAVLGAASDAAAVAGLTLKSVKRRRERLAPLSYKNYLYETGANLALATYQRTGAGCSRQRVAYDSRRIADIEEWLTTKLGPLAHFEAVDQSAPAGAQFPRDDRDRVEAAGAPANDRARGVASRCLDCCAGSAHEVRSSVAVTCPAWPFRLGKAPWRAPLSDAEKHRRRNLLSRVGKTAENSSEPENSRRANAGSSPATIRCTGGRADRAVTVKSPSATSTEGSRL